MVGLCGWEERELFDILRENIVYLYTHTVGRYAIANILAETLTPTRCNVTMPPSSLLSAGKIKSNMSRYTQDEEKMCQD